MTDDERITDRVRRAMDCTARARAPDPPTLDEVLARVRRRQADPERLRQAEAERDEAARRNADRVMRGEVPATYREARYGPGEGTDARAKLVEALSGSCRLVLLCGQLGRGKSTAAAECVRLALVKHADSNGQLHGHPLRWRSADSVGRLSGYEAGPVLEDLGAAWFLVLDDLGTETDTRQGGASGSLDGLLRDRHARRLPTIVTSNLPASEVAERYGARLMDRFREEGAAVLTCGGPNLRAARGADAACGEG